ncbi:MAG: MBL fold metallo-hydrolase [Bifidobacterium scardovii]|uniref:MBL fold metallo-hydrolase n=1 Tax=Bifidobacterium scardovii TaxID=158787 RepID=UPI0028FF2C7E|nr:MBL fold metallo-hydrolase [Bifidobacterium scardovii]MDU2420899.1 MBL fold metallo-hydrolase [Bifidobacterium scardovii]
MHITQLGTAAAERIPGIFCECDLCRLALQRQGREIRTQCQAIVDDEVLIDFPGDTYLHYLRDRFPLPSVRSLLVTHWHSDHFYGEDIAYRMGGYVISNPTEHMEVYGSETVHGFHERSFFLEQRHDEQRVAFTTVRPGDDFALHGAYRAHAFEAAHGHHAGDCLFYSLTDGERTLLYAHDTGWFPDRTWEELERVGGHYDYVSLDCNHALHGASLSMHMNFEDNLRVRDAMVRIGVADDRTIFVANHFSHNGRTTHKEMDEAARREGFLCAYDGMTVEF